MEKIEIGKRFLIPKQMKNHGLTEKTHRDPARDDGRARPLVHPRGRRPEPRARDRQRHAQGRPARSPRAASARPSSTVKRLNEYLGPPRYEYGELEAEDQTGSATGLVVTEVGGDVVAIEVTKMEGKEDFILTGQLGEVMRESARAGLSWTRAHASELGIPRETFEKNTLHIHVPAGGTPKDGPSAGITMALAIVSALTGIPVRKDVAMTGEITLRGRVLPIGGLKSKILGGAPGRGEDGDPAAQEREGPARHPRRDPEVDEARPRRLDGAGPRDGPPAQAEGARRRGAAEDRQARRQAERRAGARRIASVGRRSRRPTSRRSWSTDTR